jgi:uncharacterized protein (DUF305 family)
MKLGHSVDRTLLLIATLFAAMTTSAQTVVQPGAPGQETRVLSSDKRPTLAPVVKKDVEFMQGMIMHHGQAVEMVALMKDRTENAELLRLGARISHSQADEMRFMERWLGVRGESTKMEMAGMPMDHSHHHMPGMAMPDDKPPMPGMLSAKQMKELAAAKGKDFDRLFLSGMIQHHGGALTMVSDLFASAGAGQDADLFNFATDVDSGQRAEIKIMQGMLAKL